MQISGRNSLNLAAATCSAGLAAFYVGFTLLPEHGRSKRAGETHNREAIRAYGMAASRAGHLCLLTSAPILIWAVFAFRDVFLDGSYSGWKGVSVFESGVVWGARMLLAAGSVLVIVGRRLEGRTTPLSIVAGIVCVVFFLIHLVCGARSEIIYYLGPGVVAYSTYWQRFRFWHIAICVTVSLALFGIMVMARTADERSLNTVAITAQDGWKESVDKSIRGFSASGHVLFAAIDYVPAKHDYYFGRMQLGGIMQFIPYAKTLTGLRARDCSSASLLTFIILGENSNMGIGTTIVADFYLDMGWPGVVLGLGIFGWFCKYTHRKTSENPLSIFWAIANSCLVAGCSIVSRYSAISLIARKTIYVAVFGVGAFRVVRAHMKGAKRIAMAPQFR